MISKRENHWKFLDEELRAETEEFNKTFLTPCISLLRNSEEMYVGQFITAQNGEMVMLFPKNKGIPRKGEFLTCMAVSPELQDFNKWGNLTYRQMYKERLFSTDCVCTWITQAHDQNFILIGFSKVNLDFFNYIKNSKGIILIFGPQKPPTEYLLNLQKLINDSSIPSVYSIPAAIDIDRSRRKILIDNKSIRDYILKQIELNDDIVVEGPPGTGKTTMIADLCAILCAMGNKVLVTALTNRALMEIAEKAPVQDLLENAKIFKTNMTLDEEKELNKLKPIKTIRPFEGSLILSSYYITSGYALQEDSAQSFDYIIMDEASQAFLAMFAVCKKIGKKNIYVGDSKQLQPIVAINQERIHKYGYQPFIDGLSYICSSSDIPVLQLTESFRFSNRAALYTGMFYNNSLVAHEEKEYVIDDELQNLLSRKGGPSLILTDMPSGDPVPWYGIALVTYLVDVIHKNNPHKRIAVLTCMKKTTHTLQKAIMYTCGASENIIVETVARVQGLTSDITIYLIPDYSLMRTAEFHLFNVATSRAREHTIIIADKYITSYRTLHPTVLAFLNRLKDDQYLTIPKPKNLSREEFMDSSSRLKELYNSLFTRLLSDK